MPRPPFIVSSADVPEKSHRYPDSDEDVPQRPQGVHDGRPRRR